MKAAEFQTTVRNGTIRIPARYRDYFKKHVRVILMRQEDAAEEGKDIIDRLLEKPIRTVNFTPLSREESHLRKRA